MLIDIESVNEGEQMTLLADSKQMITCNVT
jgi:hypothetical protein